MFGHKIKPVANSALFGHKIKPVANLADSSAHRIEPVADCTVHNIELVELI